MANFKRTLPNASQFDRINEELAEMCENTGKNDVEPIPKSEGGIKGAFPEARQLDKTAEYLAQINENIKERNQNEKDAMFVANNAASTADEALGRLEVAEKDIDDIGLILAGKVDGAYVENGYLYLTSDDEVVAGPLGPFSGGGGTGGGSASYTVTLKNLLDTRVLTVAANSAVYLNFMYQSVDEEGYDDGEGVGTLTVNNVKVATLTIPQGVHLLDISSYLVSGSNSVKLKVENSEGSSRTLSYTVTVIALSMTTTFDAMGVYSGDVTFNYTVTGSGTKLVHLLMDGVEFGSEEVGSSGRSRSYTIPSQPPGAHILTVYAEVVVEGITVPSNTLTLGMIYTDASMSEPAVLSTFALEKVTQGENISIPYMAYDPQNETAAVALTVLNPDGSVYSSSNVSVDRTAQTWVAQNYPAGNVTFRISCGTAKFEKTVEVAESSIVIEDVTDALALYFDPQGRSNLEDNPSVWSDGNVTAEFSGIGFTNADGWRTDADGATALRILSGGQMTIPFKLFSNDARSSGATIEVEMATHNVRDYDTVVMSCLSNGRGFKVASQYAEIRSEQSSVSMQFKEDDKVRISFVVEPRNLHRLIYVFVDGVMCRAIQYASDDNFAQNPAAGITIGAEFSGIDVYKIRMYTKGLTRHEILSNYTFDRPTLSERLDEAKRNDIFDLDENIVISKLPATLPYMIIKCPELPQYKDDKKTCEIEYVNLSETARSFIATGAQIDVQGTSSAGYKKKNWKIKFKEGLTYTSSGEKAEKYKLRADSIPTGVICMKADVASSEGANNVELVRLYNDIVPHKTPAQEANPKVRVGIDGLPCVIFWQNTDTGEVKFWGKYNFNFDKGSEEVFGLTTGCESWEIKNNTSNRVLFKSSDFSGSTWKDDFEARYPDGNADYSKLKRMCDWVVSTDRSAVSTDEEKAARLEKFKNEFEDYFILDPMIFYYVFTETFLMVDNRAKNFFPTTFDGVHWFPFPYDMDTAIGINNEGQLVFDYDLEDTDIVNGDVVFNGQESVLWCNIRDAFPDEIKEMYTTLRSGTVFNYAEVVRRFHEHQIVWPKAVWNEDAWNKYLEPLENDNDSSYLGMLQGDKTSQREWWLFNGFRYRDSKYQCGDASTNYITLRCYQPGNITVTPYSHIWPRIKYGSYTETARGKRNVPTTLQCNLDTMSDTEVYIYSSDRLSSIGDLSHLNVGYADFSKALKLQSLKLGDGAADYQNTRLTELYVGNNELLTNVDVQNCINLATTVDLSGCVGIETVKAKGTAVTGFTLPVGGKLKRLELPNTVTNLTLRDLAQFETLDMVGYDELSTFRVENTPNVPFETIINNAPKLDRVRLIGVNWTATSEESLQTSITKLKSCSGQDANGDNTTAAVVTGRVYVPSISAELLTEINEAFPQLVVVANGEAQYVVRYLDWNNTVLYRAVVGEGDDAVNPVTAGLITAPTREGTEDTGYAFKDFGTLPTNIQNNVTVIAQYESTYRVLFTVDGTVFDTQWVVAGQTATTPTGTPTKAATAQYTFTFLRWEGDYSNITEPTEIFAFFQATTRTYAVYFYNGTTLLQTVNNVPYGGSATFTGSTPTYTGANAEDYEFIGWSPAPTNITGATSCYAQYKYTGYVSVSLVERTLSGEYVNSTITNIGDYAFFGCEGLTSVAFDVATSVGAYAFADCTSLENVNIPLVTAIGDGAFKNTCLESFVHRLATTIGNEAFADNTSLANVDLHVATSIGNNAFAGCSNLNTLIIRSDTVCACDASCLANTPIANGTGYIYIPKALVDSYKTASGLSTYANQIRAIEDYIDVVTVYTWEAASHYIDNGTYASMYEIGDTVPLDLGSEGLVNMEIVAFDTDDLADGSGKASITWISKELLKTSKRMNPRGERTYAYPEAPSWAAGTGSNANTWTSQNGYTKSDAEATWTIIATSAGTFTLSYKTNYGYTSGNKLTITVNDEVIAADFAGTTANQYSMDLLENESITISAKYSSLSSAANYNGTLTFGSTGAFTFEADIKNAPKRVNDGYQESTGCVGGWEKCEIRAYLNDTIKPLIPEAVRSKIKEVTKYSDSFDTSGTAVDSSVTTDSVWIPSGREVIDSYEQIGCIYSDKFINAASRIKYKYGGTTAQGWWTRTSTNVYQSFYSVPSNTTHTVLTSSSAEYTNGIALGFCM